jgi:hypothetical protein
MKDELLKILKYILKEYPKIDELSKPRLVKLIFLIDWKHAIVTGEQLTKIKWINKHYGPYVEDILELIKERDDVFFLNSYKNKYGAITDKIELINKTEIIELGSNKEIIDFIISNTIHYNWSDFISTVLSTYPVKKYQKFTFLDLSKDAKEFNKLRSTTANNVYKKLPK